jgi:hypothetical protein
MPDESEKRYHTLWDSRLFGAQDGKGMRVTTSKDSDGTYRTVAYFPAWWAMADQPTYTTEEAARKGHAVMVRKIRRKYKPKEPNNG